jgi:hypothetical protein
MRTTLNIADDVLRAAKQRARRENKTVGEVISELARASLEAPIAKASKPTATKPRSYHGIRPFPKRGGAVVTNELINRLREDDVY